MSGERSLRFRFRYWLHVRFLNTADWLYFNGRGLLEHDDCEVCKGDDTVGDCFPLVHPGGTVWLTNMPEQPYRTIGADHAAR